MQHDHRRDTRKPPMISGEIVRAAVSAAADVRAPKHRRAEMAHRQTKLCHNQELLMRFRVRSKETGMVWIRVVERSRGKSAAVD